MRNKKYIPIISTIIIAACAVVIIMYTNSKKTHQTVSFAMDTVITQTVYGANAEKAAAEVEEYIKSFELKASMYIASSDIAKLNKAAGGEAVSVSPQIFELLERGEQLSKQSGGVFDITVGPLSSIWSAAIKNKQLPADENIRRAVALINCDNLVLNSAQSTAKLALPGAKVDLGGITKGFICNPIGEIYAKNKVKAAVLSLGGNVYVYGQKPGGGQFKVGFRDPYADASSYIATVQFTGKIFACSGAYERFFVQDGVNYHHLLDIGSGYPAQSDIVSVGVLTQDGALADYLSTTLFLDGGEKTLQFMQTCEELGVQVIFTDVERNIYVSASLKDVFELTDASYNLIFV